MRVSHQLIFLLKVDAQKVVISFDRLSYFIDFFKRLAREKLVILLEKLLRVVFASYDQPCAIDVGTFLARIYKRLDIARHKKVANRAVHNIVINSMSCPEAIYPRHLVLTSISFCQVNLDASVQVRIVASLIDCLLIIRP